MSDAIEPRQTKPFPAEGSAPPPPIAADPLAGDWSDGLRGPLRALGIPEPKRLLLEGLPQPLPPPRPAITEPPRVAPVAEEVEAPDAWGASEDPLQSAPPPASEPPSVIITFTEPPVSAPPEVTPPSPAPSFQPDVTPPSPAPSFQPDVTPASPAPAFQAGVTPASPAPSFHSAAPASGLQSEPPPPPPLHVLEPPAPSQPASEPVMDLGAEDAADWSAPPPSDGPTPWSEPAGEPIPLPGGTAPAWDQVTAAATPAPVTSWEMTPPEGPPAEAAWSAPAEPAPAAPAEDDTWSAPPPAAEPVDEWKAEAPPSDWEEVRKPAAPAVEEPPAADWGTLSSGPDWSAPPPADAAPADDAWGSAPPPPATPDWGAPPPAAAASAWEAPAPPAAAEENDWSAPPPPPPSAPSWSAAPVGASALEQMDSEPEEMAASPEAAKDLFGSVGAGESLAGDDEEPVDLGPPEELASPEEFLRPVEMSDDDADLLVPVPEDEPPPRAPPPPPALPLGAMKPLGLGALEVQGEHRVAVHTRGGRTRRGSVKDVDLGKSQFQLMPQGGGAAEPVYHAEVKAIFFMLAAGEKPKAADGGKVRVTFADGRTIEGHRDGPDAKHGFFLVPLDAARTNTRRIYVAREATTEIKEG